MHHAFCPARSSKNGYRLVLLTLVLGLALGALLGSLAGQGPVLASPKTMLRAQDASAPLGKDPANGALASLARTGGRVTSIPSSPTPATARAAAKSAAATALATLESAEAAVKDPDEAGVITGRVIDRAGAPIRATAALRIQAGENAHEVAFPERLELQVHAPDHPVGTQLNLLPTGPPAGRNRSAGDHRSALDDQHGAVIERVPRGTYSLLVSWRDGSSRREVTVPGPAITLERTKLRGFRITRVPPAASPSPPACGMATSWSRSMGSRWTPGPCSG